MAGLLSMVGQGLSSAGTAVSQFSGDMGALQMKAEYEKQAQVLAGQLAMERTQAEIAGRHADVAAEQSGASERTGAEIQGRHADVATTEAGANTRSAATIKAEGERTAAEIAGRHADVATEQAGAGARLAQQLSVEGTSVSFDADGNTVLVNKNQKSVTPLTDASGKPIQLRDPATMQYYQQALKNLQDESRNLDIRRGQDISEAKQELGKYLGTNGIILDKAGYATAQQHLQDISDKFDALIADNRSRTAALIDSLSKHANAPAPKAPSTGNRPPLSSFDQSH